MDFDAMAYESGKKFLQENITYADFIRLIKDTHSFLSSFSFLQFGRDTVVTKLSIILSPSGVLDSAVRTLHGILLISEYGNFSDISILVRKYRDDIYFYLYLIAVYSSCNLLDDKLPDKHEQNIKKWQSNTLSDLHISEILKYIGTRPKIQNAVLKYNLKFSFDKIGNNLNNYVHGNGAKFYNQHPQSYSNKDFQSFISLTKHCITYTTVSFLFLLALCNPISIMSSDYTDYLDCGDTPPEDSQYWVAPFVAEYMKKYYSLLGDDCINYLREITQMNI